MTRSALYISLVLHVALVAVAMHWLNPSEEHEVELVDIEVAPPPPIAEALPAEVARQIEQAEEDHAAEEAAAAAAADKAQPNEPGLGAADAGVDAPIDAPPDAALVAHADAGALDAATQVAIADAGARDAAQVAIADAGVQVALADAGPLAPDANEQVATAASGAGSALDGSASAGSGSAGSGSSIATGNGSNGAGSGSGHSDLLGFGSGAGSSLGTGSSGSGSPAAIATGSGSGVAGMDNQPAVDGAPTSAGTDANVLAYFPAGHTIGVLVRFDRLRGTEWANAAEELFRPMPDYQSLFGSRNAGIADKLDMLVISTPRPRDATATTLVMQTHLPRSSIRTLLTSTSTPIAWSATRAGALGKRSGKLFANDKRVVISPWQGWYLLAQPDDLGSITATSGSVDSIEAKGKLPAWLTGIRTITKESGDEKKGPALVLTVGEPPSNTGPAKSGRYKLPEIGLGVSSLPVPQRISLAMELVKQGWLVRGNIVFATEADAAELETTLNDLKTRITDSHLLSALLRKQHVLNIVSGLSLARTGARISYATSISISDARAILSAAAQTLGGYFGQVP
ncbi:MAG TPA: hypothetical protein VF403_24450 [Kofleriaceae bacterium]